MSQKFYFDLTNGSATIHDDEGIEANNIEQATTEAQAVLDEMRGNAEKSVPVENWYLIIRNESGEMLKKLSVPSEPVQ